MLCNHISRKFKVDRKKGDSRRVEIPRPRCCLPIEYFTQPILLPVDILPLDLTAPIHVPIELGLFRSDTGRLAP